MTLHYDPLLAKLIVTAPTREAAIARMARALDELVVTGIDTSAPFHRRVMDEQDFMAGSLSIRYVEEHPGLLMDDALEAEPEVMEAVAIAVALLEEEDRVRGGTVRLDAVGDGEMSRWRSSGWPWRIES